MKTIIAILFLLATSAIAEPVDVFHQVDVQKSFWVGMHGEVDGPLVMPGTSAITANISRLVQLAHASRKIKSISSRDIRFPVEGRIYTRIGVSGAAGPDRIPEAELYAKEKQLTIPHNVQVGDRLELVPFDLEAARQQILDPDVELVIEKNGMNAYDVFKNPRTEKVYAMLKPKRVFIYGVATDWCVDGAVNSLLDRGYEVYIIKDAIDGVDEELSRQKLAKMEKRGAKMVTTSEVMAMYPEAAAKVRIARPGCDISALKPR